MPVLVSFTEANDQDETEYEIKLKGYQPFLLYLPDFRKFWLGQLLAMLLADPFVVVHKIGFFSISAGAGFWFCALIQFLQSLLLSHPLSLKAVSKGSFQDTITSIFSRDWFFNPIFVIWRSVSLVLTYSQIHRWFCFLTFCTLVFLQPVSSCDIYRSFFLFCSNILIIIDLIP